MERSVWIGLGLLLLGAAVPAQPAKRWDDSKPAWKWTVEERLAKRFDPADLKARSTLDGADTPELFLPSELFLALLMKGYPPDGRHQADARRSIDERAAALGFGADFWKRLGKVAAPYLELRRERDRLSLAPSRSAADEKRLAGSLAPEVLCRVRAEALAAAKAELGEEPFLRLLYSAVAPSLGIGSSIDDGKAAAQLLHVERGCR